MSTLTSCPLLYLLPCRNLVTPIKNVLKSVARKELYPRWLSPVLVRFWWRWGESNSRPEHFSSCFTQPFTYYTLYILNCQIILNTNTYLSADGGVTKCGALSSAGAIIILPVTGFIVIP